MRQAVPTSHSLARAAGTASCQFQLLRRPQRAVVLKNHEPGVLMARASCWLADKGCSPTTAAKEGLCHSVSIPHLVARRHASGGATECPHRSLDPSNHSEQPHSQLPHASSCALSCCAAGGHILSCHSCLAQTPAASAPVSAVCAGCTLLN